MINCSNCKWCWRFNNDFKDSLIFGTVGCDCKDRKDVNGTGYIKRPVKCLFFKEKADVKISTIA